MKKKLPVLLALIILSCMAAGCNSSDKNNDQSTASAASISSGSSAGSEVGNDTSESDGSEAKDDASKDSGSSSNPENTSSGQEESAVESGSEDTEGDLSYVIEGDGVSIDENGNITIDPDQISGLTEDSGSEGDDGTSDDLFADGYQIIQLSPEGFKDGSSLPSCNLITSAQELSDYIKNNSTEYSLEKKYSDNADLIEMSFAEQTKDMDADFFKENDVLVIVTECAKGADCDIGNTALSDKEVKIELWAPKAEKAEDKGYSCFIAAVTKDTFKGKTISAWANSEMPTAEEG